MKKTYIGLQPIAKLIRAEEHKLLQKEIDSLQAEFDRVKAQIHKFIATSNVAFQCDVCKGLYINWAEAYGRYYHYENNPSYNAKKEEQITLKYGACDLCDLRICFSCREKTQTNKENRYCVRCKRKYCSFCSFCVKFKNINNTGVYCAFCQQNSFHG